MPGRWRSSAAAIAVAIPASLVGLTVGLLVGDPMPGIAFGLGLLVGGAAALVVAALRASPPGVGGAAIEDAAAGWAEFHREMARARRFDGRFGIVRFGSGAAGDVETLDALRNAVAAASRRIDRVWVDDGHLLLLLPEASKQAAQAAVARIRAEAPGVAALETGMAVFPEDGITSGALITAVYGGGAIEVPTPLAALRTDRPAASSVPPQGAMAITDDDVATRRG